MPISIAPALLQVVPARDSIAVAADVASIVVAVAVLVVVAIIGMLALKLNRAIGEMRIGVRQNLGPVSDRARSISDNVEFITQVLRSDVESLDASVQALTDRLTLASERMEERIEELNALMEVVQGEAEDIFIDTASTVRGVREGARSIAAAQGRARSDAAAADEGLESEPDTADAETGDASRATRPALTGVERSDARADGAR